MILHAIEQKVNFTTTLTEAPTIVFSDGNSSCGNKEQKPFFFLFRQHFYFDSDLLILFTIIVQCMGYMLTLWLQVVVQVHPLVSKLYWSKMYNTMTLNYNIYSQMLYV